MNTRLSAPQSGFTLIEIMISVAIAMLAITAGLQTFATSERLATDSRLELRAAAAYRDAHAALRTQLLNADIDTLTGFDAAGISSGPKFREVLGMVGSDVQLGPERGLAFRGYPGVVHDVPGVGPTQVGDIVLQTAGELDEVLVRNAVRGSFQVRQEGRALVVRLATIHGFQAQHMKRVAGETVISLRN